MDGRQSGLNAIFEVASGLAVTHPELGSFAVPALSARTSQMQKLREQSCAELLHCKGDRPRLREGARSSRHGDRIASCGCSRCGSGCAGIAAAASASQHAACERGEQEQHSQHRARSATPRWDDEEEQACEYRASTGIPGNSTRHLICGVARR